MSNEITKIIDTITPKVFNAYMDQYINEHSLLVRSGAVVADERVSRNITAGGLTVNMPFWNDLSGEDQVLSEDKEIETGKITSGKDVAAVLYRGQGWSVNELAGVVSGSDPMRAILDRIGGFWLRQEQKVLMAVLKGLFATSGPLADTHLLDLSKKTGKAAVVDAKAILDAKQLMGDASRKLKILAV
ncbi:TPA: coat protein, partial [Streptococcus suis]|nr:coat protein [Streptococcus suis]